MMEKLQGFVAKTEPKWKPTFLHKATKMTVIE